MEVELVKLPYESPNLKLYGTLVELTMSTEGPLNDG